MSFDVLSKGFAANRVAIGEDAAAHDIKENVGAMVCADDFFGGALLSVGSGDECV